jgi:diguanylate cyclase (GGDEF)-like protein
VGNDLDKKQLEELLTALKSSASLSPYSLTLYCREQADSAGQSRFLSCCSIVEDPLCRDMSGQFFEKDLDAFFREATPTVCRYGGGFFGFVVPFRMGTRDFCLLGDGVRDQSIDLWQLAALSRRGGGELFSLFPQVEGLCTATLEQVNEAARDAARQIAKLAFPSRPADPAPADCVQSDRQLAAVADCLEQLERARTMTESIALCCETVATHFNPARMAVALHDANGARYEVSGIWGLPDDLGSIPADAIEVFLSRDKVKKTVLYDASMRRLLPALQATLYTGFPFRSQGEHLGFLALLDSNLHKSELQLVSMLAHATAARLSRVMKDAEQLKASALSGRLMSLANTLLLVDNKEQLYEAVLGIASDLIDATQGSIMLIDKNGESMHIVFTLGMTLKVARCLPIKVGKGIAGQVAQSGEPLLINDVEKDTRVAMANRPRFKSKSLICIPLKLKEKIIGVLNLSDKQNLAPFTPADLQLLTSFANLASLMIERSLVLEESVRFEQLSVTDALTGLYNRRFLKSRLEEELNRSIRQELNLTVLFIDLDFFKSYNDVCGHIAGDRALKKTAEIIKASLREMDIVARYGGEEFCAVLPGTSKAEAMIVAERIRGEIEREKFPGECDIPLRRITASLGVASFPEDGRTFTELVHASDVALYQAKAGGRNRIVALHRTQTPHAPQPSSLAKQHPEPASLTKALDFNAYLEATIVPKVAAQAENSMERTELKRRNTASASLGGPS